MAGNSKKYYGKYKGTVVNNLDPVQLGRIQVQVAEVTGLVPTTWAMPCSATRRRPRSAAGSS
jgi:hypothetical protein